MIGNLTKEGPSRLGGSCDFDSSEFSTVSCPSQGPQGGEEAQESSSMTGSEEAEESQLEGVFDVDISVSQEEEEKEDIGDDSVDDAIQIMLLPKNDQADIDEAPNPKLIDSLISKQMSELSTRDREEVYYDIHGVSGVIDEDAEPGFLDRKLEEMQQQLESIDDSQKEAYLQAYSANPQYVMDAHLKLRFLRADRFDTKLAAQRYINHYETKLELFGAEKLGRDIIQDDLDGDTLDALYCSLNQLLPQRDRAGRAVVLFVSGGRQHSDSLRALMCRAFYNAMLVTEDVETQRKGVIACVYACGISTRSGHVVDSESEDVRSDTVPNRAWKLAQLFRSMPVRVVAMHFCYSNLAWIPVMAALRWALDWFTRVRFRAHRGSHSECMYSLQTFGIPTSAMPFGEYGDLLTEKYRKFLQNRRIQERKWKENQPHAISFSNKTRVVVPSNNDVLFGRGKGYFNHMGNIRYRSLIEDLKEQYDKSKLKVKKQLTMEIVYIVHKSGARFLKEDGDGGAGCWVLVEDEAARLKVSHSFRALRLAASSQKQKTTATKKKKAPSHIHGGETFESLAQPGSKRTRAS